MNAIIEDLTKNNRELAILEVVKEFNLKYSEAATIVDATKMFEGLYMANEIYDNTIDDLIERVFSTIRACFNLTQERLNEISEFIEWVEGTMKVGEYGN